MKLTLYLFLGSVVALVGVLAMVFASGANTFDILALEKAGSPPISSGWFPFVSSFRGSGRPVPIPQLGAGWSCGSPTAVSMLLAVWK
jgi:NADH-quinone oxidoreductase subunit M